MAEPLLPQAPTSIILAIRSTTLPVEFQPWEFFWLIFTVLSKLLLHLLKAGPPLDLSFWSFFDFFALWYRRRRDASSVKIL